MEVLIIGIIVILGFMFEKKYKPKKEKSVKTAYLLWFFSFFGIMGFHRFYLAKYGTGFLWIFSGGVFGIGAVIDLFTISNQVENHNLRYKFLDFVNSVDQSTILNQNTNKDQNNLDKSKNEILLNKDIVEDQVIKSVMLETSNIKNINDTFIDTNITNFNDDSIIDVTDQSYKINSYNNLTKYISSVPYWENKYVYSKDELKNASSNQKEFYFTFKNNFFNKSYYDLEGNNNYSFILLYDLVNEYEIHKNILELEQHLINLGKYYPKTQTYCSSILSQKKKLTLNTEEKVEIESKINNNYHSNITESLFSNDDFNWSNKYKTKLNLSSQQGKILDKIWNPINNFLEIEFCCIEVIKLYIELVTKLNDKHLEEGKSFENEVAILADLIATQYFQNNKGSQQYIYSLGSITNTIYSYIFKLCENTVREIYGHKRKLNVDVFYNNAEVNSEFELKIINKIYELLPTLISTVVQPDELTEIELNSKTINRWKIKFDELTKNYKNDHGAFLENILTIVDLNKKNPNKQTIFFEASKFIAKHNEIVSLKLYIYYIYHNVNNLTSDIKQLTKSVQKMLFKNDEQLNQFTEIISELTQTKNIDKALNEIPNIYKLKRKKIQLDKTIINEVRQKHTGTVKLLNEYLGDNLEDENNLIQSEEIKDEIFKMDEEYIETNFLSELTFNKNQLLLLELFSKHNFSISQIDIEKFAKSKGVFKNQLIESVNEICYDILDDVLIEEDEDYYNIIPEYFQKIKVK